MLYCSPMPTIAEVESGRLQPSSSMELYDDDKLLLFSVVNE